MSKKNIAKFFVFLIVLSMVMVSCTPAAQPTAAVEQPAEPTTAAAPVQACSHKIGFVSDVGKI